MKAFAPQTVCLSLLLFCMPVSADIVTIVADRWYPYNGIPSSPTPGYGIEIAQYGLALGGHTVKYQLMSWEKALQQVTTGNKDCIIGAYKREAPNFIFPEQPIGIDQIIFIKRKDNDWLYRGVESLKEIRLGNIPGYEYSPEIAQYIKHHAKPENLSNTRGKYALEFNLIAMLKGELDAVIDSKTVLYSTLNKHDWGKEVVHAGNADSEASVHIACSPANAKSIEYAKWISIGIEQLRTTGELDSILKKYNIEDWYPKVTKQYLR